MDTTTKQAEQTKEAQITSYLKTVLKGLGLAKSVTTDDFKGYLALAATLGALSGAGAGVVSSYAKSRNPEILSLERQKKFYDRRIGEMDNENWLNDLLTAKKRLETAKMDDAERKALEEKYVKLINR